MKRTRGEEEKTLRISHYLKALFFHVNSTPSMAMITFILNKDLIGDVIQLIIWLISFLTFREYQLDDLILSYSHIISQNLYYKVIFDKAQRLKTIGLVNFRLNLFDGLVINIASGLKHTILHTTRGLFGFGSNESFQLGIGGIVKEVVETNPKFIDIKEDACNILSVHCGDSFTVVLTTNACYVFGSIRNIYANDLDYIKHPREIKTQDNSKIISVTCTAVGIFILTKTGLYLCEGFNQGSNLYTKSILPSKWIKKEGGIAKISAGYSHLMILTNRGNLYGCGDNRVGQIGLDAAYIYTSSTYHNIPLPNAHDKNIKSVHCGLNHTMILTFDGLLYATGGNSKGELGLGDFIDRYEFTRVPIDNVTEIHLSCTAAVSTIVTRDGSIYTCGDNSSTKLGLGKNETSNKSLFTLLNVI